MNEVKPYVYQIQFVPTGQKYVGLRYGNKVSANQDFWNHYFTSSKVVKSLIDEHSKDSFVIEWIKEFETQEDAIEYEHKCLVENDVGMNDDWLNQTSNYPVTSDVYKKIMLEKFGVDSYFQTEEFKEKLKQTSLEKFGVDHPAKTNEFKEKKKQTNLEKFGVENPFESDEIKEKIKQTMLEKYDVDHYSKTNEYKEKYKQTILKRFGVDHVMRSDEIKEKQKQSILEKFGVDNYFKTDEFKEKRKQTSLEKFGVENYAQTDECKEKKKQTMLEKYGVEYPSQIKSKCLECECEGTSNRIIRHHKKTGHKGKLVLLADGTWEKRE